MKDNKDSNVKFTNERFKINEELLLTAKSDNEIESKIAYEKLLDLNMGLIKSIVIHYLNRGIEFDDLVQIGTLGLLKAIEGFDPSRQCSFSTYAMPVISGEIKRHIRDSGPIKVSRIYKRNAAILLKEKNRIIETEGRDPSIKELAQRCGLDDEEAAIALDSSMPIMSIYEPRYDEGSVSIIDSMESERASEEINSMNDKIALSQEIKLLPPFWKKIILLRYFRNKTQTECAEILGVSQVKISREEKKILEHLRGKLI